MAIERDPASFRDPSGHVFRENGVIRRQINPSYFRQYDELMRSGLYDALAGSGRLVRHTLITQDPDRLVIEPEPLPFISYPYEWSLSQLRDAAELTLDIHLAALGRGMVLKDASAFNVQFAGATPVFIDTLSFDLYEDGAPWAAYGQFCRHFLAPLELMQYVSVDLNRLHTQYLDGLPLELASALLPFRSHFSPQVQANIHLHARSLRRHKERFAGDKVPHIALTTQKNIVTSLKAHIGSLKPGAGTEWGDYYRIANYSGEAFSFKENTVSRWVQDAGFRRLWDIGGNDGHFSRLVQPHCERILCTDIDPVAVDTNYRRCRERGDTRLVPLVVDYANPSPGIGFANLERKDLQSRVRQFGPDCLLALALIHHLCLSNNCSFEMLADSFASQAPHLVIEFVRPADSWAARLLESKREARRLFEFYDERAFEAAFSRRYEILERAAIPGSERTLYRMRSRT